jgi:hypothetical protein
VEPFEVDPGNPGDIRKDVSLDGQILLNDTAIVKLNQYNGQILTCPAPPGGDEGMMGPGAEGLMTMGLEAGPAGELDAAAGSTVTLSLADDCGSWEVDGEFVIDEDAEPTAMAGLANLTLKCEFADDQAYDGNIVLAIDPAGAKQADVPAPQDSTSDNCVLEQRSFWKCKLARNGRRRYAD